MMMTLPWDSSFEMHACGFAARNSASYCMHVYKSAQAIISQPAGQPEVSLKVCCYVAQIMVQASPCTTCLSSKKHLAKNSGPHVYSWTAGIVMLYLSKLQQSIVMHASWHDHNPVLSRKMPRSSIITRQVESQSLVKTPTRKYRRQQS